EHGADVPNPSLGFSIGGLQRTGRGARCSCDLRFPVALLAEGVDGNAEPLGRFRICEAKASLLARERRRAGGKLCHATLIKHVRRRRVVPPAVSFPRSKRDRIANT